MFFYSISGYLYLNFQNFEGFSLISYVLTLIYSNKALHNKLPLLLIFARKIIHLFLLKKCQSTPHPHRNNELFLASVPWRMYVWLREFFRRLSITMKKLISSYSTMTCGTWKFSISSQPPSKKIRNYSIYV